MTVSIRAAIAGALLLSLATARVASAQTCTDDEVPQQYDRFAGQRVRYSGIIATPQGFAVSWEGPGWQTATVHDGVVTAHAQQAASDYPTSVVAAAPEARLTLTRGVFGYVAQRLKPDGTPIGDALRFGEGSWGQQATAAFDGAHFVVAWTDPDRTNESRYDVMAMLVGTDGVAGSPVHVAKTAAAFGLHSVHIGNATWIIWSGSPSTDVGGVFGVRLDATGALLDRTPVAISKGSHVLASTSLGDRGLLAVMGFYGKREVVALDARGAGAPVDVSSVGFDHVVSVTGDPRGDGYLLWTVNGWVGDAPNPYTSYTVTGYALRRDGAIATPARFATFDGLWPAVAFDGHELRYVAIDESASLHYSRIHTGTISKTGAVEEGIELAGHDYAHETGYVCVPRSEPYEDEYAGCSVSGTRAGATSAALVLMAAAVVVLPRRRRRR